MWNSASGSLLSSAVSRGTSRRAASWEIPCSMWNSASGSLLSRPFHVELRTELFHVELRAELHHGRFPVPCGTPLPAPSSPRLFHVELRTELFHVELCVRRPPLHGRFTWNFAPSCFTWNSASGSLLSTAVSRETSPRAASREIPCSTWNSASGALLSRPFHVELRTERSAPCSPRLFHVELRTELFHVEQRDAHSSEDGVKREAATRCLGEVSVRGVRQVWQAAEYVNPARCFNLGSV